MDPEGMSGNLIKGIFGVVKFIFKLFALIFTLGKSRKDKNDLNK